MPKIKTKLLSILCAFFIVLGIAILASAMSQQLVIHTLDAGSPKDGATYEVLNYNGVILTFTQNSISVIILNLFVKRKSVHRIFKHFL